jgi:predicted nucleic acid-binding protein
VATKGLLVDTGPLVAILSERDQHHLVCVEAAKRLHGPFFTSWTVITEAAYLLKDRPDAVSKLLDRVRSLKLRLLQLSADDIDGVDGILKRYADQGLDLADATLMYLADREGLESVFTVDRRHFSVYRTRQGRSLSLHPATL